MDIKWLETRATESDPKPAGNDYKLIIQVDRETEITVYGFGCGEAQMTVRNLNPGNAGYDPSAIIDWDGMVKWLVWAEPTTIAHLVMDTIQSQ